MQIVLDLCAFAQLGPELGRPDARHIFVTDYAAWQWSRANYCSGCVSYNSKCAAVPVGHDQIIYRIISPSSTYVYNDMPRLK